MLFDVIGISTGCRKYPHPAKRHFLMRVEAETEAEARKKTVERVPKAFHGWDSVEIRPTVPEIVGGNDKGFRRVEAETPLSELVFNRGEKGWQEAIQ